MIPLSSFRKRFAEIILRIVLKILPMSGAYGAGPGQS